MVNATDYEISTPSFPGASEIESAFNGSFYIVNSGNIAGTLPVNWTVYYSTDNIYQNTDIAVDTGLIAALEPSAFTTEILFSGTWPSIAADYYLIIVVSSADDDNIENDSISSSPITVSVAPYIEYSITDTVFPTDGNTSSVFNGTFKIENTGNLTGANNITWTVYISDDNILSTGADAEVSSGSILPLSAGIKSQILSFTGTWPDIAGDYYIYIVIYASDDSNSNNNEVSSMASITEVTGVDYIIVNPVTPDQGIIDSNYDGTFQVQNVGLSNGLFTTSWNVYLSEDNIYDQGDISLGAGLLAGPLSSSAISAAIPYSGTWSSVAGNYYIIIKISASDDVDDTNNELISGPITITEVVDYSLVDENFPVSGSLTGSFTGSFKITNVGTVSGTQTLDWSVYRSSNQVIDVSDTLVSSGTQSLLASGASSGAIAYSGTWPETAGNYYLIISISTSEDVITSNNETVSSLIGVIDSGRLITVGASATIKYSDDGGTTWNSSMVTPSTTYYLDKVATNGAGVWVAVGENLILYYSIDNGLTWQAGIMDASVTVTTNNINDIAFHNGKWIAVGDYGSSINIILYSSDGINWSMADGYSSYAMQSVIYDYIYDRWYTTEVSSRGFYIEYDVNGLPVSTLLAAGTGGFYGLTNNNDVSPPILMAGGYSLIKYSTDGGVSWTESTTQPTGNDFRGIAFDGGVTWVVVSKSYNTINYSINNGVDWTQAASYDNSNSFYDITYDIKSGRFVAIGSYGTVLYSSDGGSNWVKAANTGTTHFYGIAVGP